MGSAVGRRNVVRYKIIVFDFDGTLVESNQIKRDGFAHAFADHPQCASAVPAVLAEMKAASRHEIIRSLVDRIPGLTPAQREAESTRRIVEYSDWIELQIIDQAAYSPAGDLLGRWQQHANLYVCSLTPVEYLRRILERLGWRRFFADLEGYPVNKEDMLRRTALRHRVTPAELLMVGDSADDEAAARRAQTEFFGVSKVADLLALDRYLRT
jgi:phosphoglycolate phosphatase